MKWIPTSRAAEILGVHEKTLRRWAHETVSGAPDCHLQNVKRDMSRKRPRYYYDEDEIRSLPHREYDYF